MNLKVTPKRVSREPQDNSKFAVPNGVLDPWNLDLNTSYLDTQMLNFLNFPKRIFRWVAPMKIKILQWGRRKKYETKNSNKNLDVRFSARGGFFQVYQLQLQRTLKHVQNPSRTPQHHQNNTTQTPKQHQRTNNTNTKNTNNQFPNESFVGLQH